jgi:hypothetical protein
LIRAAIRAQREVAVGDEFVQRHVETLVDQGAVHACPAFLIMVARRSRLWTHRSAEGRFMVWWDDRLDGGIARGADAVVMADSIRVAWRWLRAG